MCDNIVSLKHYISAEYAKYSIPRADMEKQQQEKLLFQAFEASDRAQGTYDPLGINSVYGRFSEYLREGATGVIVHEAKALVDRFNSFDRSQCTPAQLRSLFHGTSMVFTSAVLTGRPYDREKPPSADDIVPGSQAILMELATAIGVEPRINDQTYPYDYTDSQEVDPGPLRYTDDRITIRGRSAFAEEVFKASVGFGLRGQERTIPTLAEISQSELSHPQLPYLLDKARGGFYDMSVAVGLVRDYLPPDYFAPKLLPFLQKYQVDGKEYAHTGAHMTGVLLANLILFGTQDQVIVAHHRENIPYAATKYQPFVARVEENMEGRSSLIDEWIERLEDIESRGESANELEQAVTVHLFEFAREVQTFRGRHRTLVKNSMQYRPPAEKGSGGQMDIVQELMDRTNAKVRKLRPYYNRLRGQEKEAA